MKTPLVDIQILSIYKKSGQRVMLPAYMARCTPDQKNALLAVKTEVAKKGGNLYLSDLFRSYDMQLQAYLDWQTKKKEAYSPPPGGSMHEAGRAFDLDLDALKMSLGDFWEIAARNGLSPIIDTPKPGAKEAWHFECRGSHDIVYAYYKSGKGTNFDKPYRAMAASAILAIGQSVDMFKGKVDESYVQSALIRLGKEIGNIDGDIGPKTRKGLSELGLSDRPILDLISALDQLLQVQFPNEFYDYTPLDRADTFDLSAPSRVLA